MNHFKYQPLNLEDRSFRLVRLFRGDNGPIECELFHAWLHDDEDGIEYTALSYTWGDIHEQCVIDVNGRKMLVTENLYLALKNIRWQYQDRIMWIDAICIDQGNFDERGHQVQHMGTIFKRAEQVVIWMGPPTLDTDLVFEYMQQLETLTLNYACNDWRSSDNRWQILWSTAEISMRNESENDQFRRRNGFQVLLGRSWFKRVWILQEVANARSARVICGAKSVSARIFAIVPLLIGITPDSHCQAVLDIMPGPSRRHSWWIENRSLHTLLLKFQSSEASDPRDIIYALLGISSDGSGSDSLVPNYTKSIEQVIHDTIKFILHLHGWAGNEEPFPQWSLSEFRANLGSLRWKLLSWAVEHQHEAIVKLLFDKDKDDDKARDIHAKKSLSEPSDNGQSEIVKLLLELSESDDNAMSSHEKRPLLVAARDGLDTVVELLLNTCKVDPDVRDMQGRTPLMWATQNGHETIVKLLLDTGKVDADTRDLYRRTPLWEASGNGHIGIVKLFLDISKVNTNAKSNDKTTPLLLAARNGHDAVVKLLLDTGKADAEAKDKYGETPLSLAVQAGHRDVVKLLLDSGKVDANAEDKYGQTPLLRASENGHCEVVKLLLDVSNADPNTKSSDGRTPLLLAAQNGHEAVVKLLLHSDKVEVDVKDKYGETPLSCAAQKGHGAVVKLLLDTGNVDLNSTDYIWRLTPLSWAMQNGHAAVVRLLQPNVDS